MDRQGIEWSQLGLDRKIYRKKRESQFEPFRDNMDKPMPKFTKQNKSHNNMYEFQSYYQNLSIKITHFQLRYCIQCLTPNDLIFVSKHGMSLLNTIQNLRIDKELKYDLKPTMLNSQDYLLAMGGLDGDVSIIDSRNLKEISHFMISDSNNITNFVGFLSNSDNNFQQSQQHTILDNNNISQIQEEIQLIRELSNNIQQNNNNSYSINNNNENNMDIENVSNNNINSNNIIQQEQQQQSICNDLNVKLITGCNDKNLKLFDLESRKQIHQEEFGSAPNVAAYNKEKQLIALQCDQLQTEILDSKSLKTVMNLKGHEDYGFSVDWSPNGLEVATGNQDGTVRIFDIRTGKCLKILQGEIGHTCCVKYTDQHLVVGEAIDYIHIFDRYKDYQQQTIDFFGEPNGVAICKDKLYFGVNMCDYEGIFEYNLSCNQNSYNIDILQQYDDLDF